MEHTPISTQIYRKNNADDLSINATISSIRSSHYNLTEFLSNLLDPVILIFNYTKGFCSLCEKIKISLVSYDVFSFFNKHFPNKKVAKAELIFKKIMYYTTAP